MRSEAGASERVMKNIEVSVIHQAASQLQAAAVDLDELERAASGNVLQEIQKYRTARRRSDARVSARCILLLNDFCITVYLRNGNADDRFASFRHKRTPSVPVIVFASTTGFPIR